MYLEQENILEKNERKRALNNARIIIYNVLFLWGLFITYIAPFHYLCDDGKYVCKMCGMRTAVKYLIKMQWKSAYEKNHYIFMVFIVVIIACLDEICMLMEYKTVDNVKKKS